MILTQSYSVLYFCSDPKKWEVDVTPDQQLAGHFFARLNSKYIVWPEKIDANTMNPENVDSLFKKLPRAGLLLLDRVWEVEEFVSIVGHVNRAGTNMLIGNTPYNGRPHFPDMSHIYRPISDYPQVVVHTLGPERFKQPPWEANIVWSEAVGLVAPVFHYLDFQLSALGGDPSRVSLSAELLGLSVSS